jgi:hypothetical protein
MQLPELGVSHKYIVWIIEGNPLFSYYMRLALEALAKAGSATVTRLARLVTWIGRYVEVVATWIRTLVEKHHGVTAATWVGSIGVVIAFVLALFQERIHRWRYHPVFVVTARNGPPDCVRIGLGPAMSYYLRVMVENVGTETARNVEIYANSLTKWTGAAWQAVRQFPPMNLVWANSPAEPFFRDRVYLPILAPKTGKHCDIAHIIDPKMRCSRFESGAFVFEAELNPALNLGPCELSLTFDLIQKPSHKGYIVGPGAYHLEIGVSAENGEPKKFTLEIRVERRWYDDEKEMFDQSIKIRVFEEKKTFFRKIRRRDTLTRSIERRV